MVGAAFFWFLVVEAESFARFMLFPALLLVFPLELLSNVHIFALNPSLSAAWKSFPFVMEGEDTPQWFVDYKKVRDSRIVGLRDQISELAASYSALETELEGLRRENDSLTAIARFRTLRARFL